MSECGIKKLIDNTDDYTAIDRAVQFAEKDRRLKAGVRRAKEFDRYGTPDTRVDQYTDRVNEMVGGVLTLESIEGNTFEDIYIDRADNYGNGNVRINGDKLIKLSWGKTADGMYTASIYKGSKKLGSEGSTNKVSLGTATKKKITLKARVLTKQEKIITSIDGVKETENTGKIGDYVITGLKGEEYIVPASKFNEKYTVTETSDATLPATAEELVNSILASLDDRIIETVPSGFSSGYINARAHIDSATHLLRDYSIDNNHLWSTNQKAAAYNMVIKSLRKLITSDVTEYERSDLNTQLDKGLIATLAAASERTLEKDQVKVTTRPTTAAFKYATEDMKFTASWGEKMIAKKGDALVYEKGKLSYRIEKEIFTKTYDITANSKTIKDAEGIDKLIKESKVAKMSNVTGTVVQNLEDIVNKMLDKDGSRLSEEHQSHLMDVFSTYYSNLQEVGKDVKIDAELFEALDDKINTRGDADPKSGKIRLVLGNQVNHTLTEILAHEMQHTLLSKVISRDAKINTAIRKFRGEFRRHLTKKYNGEGWKVFMRDGITPEMAKEEYEYTIDNNTLSDMDEFLAAITTNESLVSELGTMTREPYELLSRPRDTSTKIGKIWDNLVQLINNAYDGFKKSISKSPREAREYAIHLLDTAMKAAHRDERETSKSWYDKTLEAISKGDSKIAEITGDINKEHKTLKQHLEDKEQSAVNRVMSRIWKIRGLAKVRSMMLQNAVFSSVTRNMTNPYIAKFYEMFRHSKAFVEKEVVAMKNVTADVLDKKYGFGKLSKTTRKALKRVVIDLDAQVLGKAEDVLGYLKDEDKVTRELREIKKQLNPNSWGAIRELANLLVTNKMTKKNGYVNAAQIWMDYEDGKDTVDQIDKAATLMAIQMSSEHNKAEAIKGLEANLEGVDRVLEMVRASNKEVLEKAYDNNAMYEVKGAKQEVFGREGGIDKKHYLVDKKQMEELVKAGMYNIGKHTELSRVMGEDRYVVVGDSIEVAYTEGMMSVVQLKSEGDSLKAILLESGMLEEDVKKKIIGMARERGKAEEVMIPERTGDGVIYDYKIRLAHEVKEKYMEMDDDIIGVVASTISNLTHKQEAMINNKNAVTYFKKFYDENKESDEFKFIEISANSKGKYKEYWDLIPTYMKKTIAQHDTPLMIEEGLLVDMFGYKDVSMTQLPWVRDSVKRQLVAKKIETVVKEVTARWKKVMVAFTIATIKGNMTSNMLVAMQHTKNKNPVNYMSEFKDIWVEMNEYQDNRKKYVELEVRKKAGEKIAENEFKMLERAMHTSRVHDIMEDGQYNAILEDINTEYFDNKGMIESKIDELIKKASKGNDKGALKDFVDVLYIRKDSRQHDSIMKLTTFSDAINKVIILEDMKRSNDGEVTQEMLNYVDSLHVNYGYLDNRYVKYANDMGFLTFTKYFFRVIPAIAKMAGKKSISMLFTETAVNTTGLGETPMSQLWNPFDSLLRKFTLWGDPLDVGGAVINPAVL